MKTKTIIRAAHDLKTPYTVISNACFQSGLSLKAMGLLTYMLSKPDDWLFSRDSLAYQLNEGRDSIDSALKELESKGHIVRKRHRDEKGSFTKFAIEVHEVSIGFQSDYPLTGNPAVGFPAEGNPTEAKPALDNPAEGNPPLLSTNVLSTDLPNTEVANKNTNLTVSAKSGEQEALQKNNSRDCLEAESIGYEETDEPDPENHLANHGLSKPEPKKLKTNPRHLKTQIPEDLTLTCEWREAAISKGLHPDWVDDEFENFHRTFIEKGSKKSRWDWTWQKWAQNTISYHPSRMKAKPKLSLVVSSPEPPQKSQKMIEFENLLASTSF